MNIPPNLIWPLWCAGGLAVLAIVAGTVGFSLLLGTIAQRKVGLPLVWGAVSVFVAASIAIIMILTHS